MKRGMNMPDCTQRTNSSASGAGPAKPPMSWPVLETPDSARPSPILQIVLQRLPGRRVVARPGLRVALHAGHAGARLTTKGRLSGACARCASREARIISSGLQRLGLARRRGRAEAVHARRAGSRSRTRCCRSRWRRCRTSSSAVGDLLLPPGERRGIGEVEIGADLVPELHPGRRAVGVARSAGPSSRLPRTADDRAAGRA